MVDLPIKVSLSSAGSRHFSSFFDVVPTGANTVDTLLYLFASTFYGLHFDMLYSSHPRGITT